MADFSINWGALQPANIGGALMSGYERGQAMRREADTRSALSDYVANPGVATAGALARIDPERGLDLMGKERERATVAANRTTATAALGGDVASLHRLATNDPEMFARIRPEVERVQGLIANAARWADTPEKWDQVIDQYAQDYPQLHEYRGRFSPALRASVIAEAGQIGDFIREQQPHYQTIAPGGAIVGMDQNGQNMGYVAGGPADAPDYVPPAARGPQDAPQAQPATAATPQALTPDEGGRILSTARQSRTISAEDAQRMVASLGPNGQAQFQRWAQANGVTVGQTAPTLTLDAIDAELARRRGAGQ